MSTCVRADDLAGCLAAMAPPGAVVLAGEIDALQGPLYGPEPDLIRTAVEERQAEFTAGRTLARRALAGLGGPRDVAIGQDSAGAPRWPTGFLGAITHTGGQVAVAVACADSGVRAIGLDMERGGPLDAHLLPEICDRRELANSPAPQETAKQIFVIKEAFFKAYWPCAHKFLDFLDVHVDLDADAGRFVAGILTPAHHCPVSGATMTGRYSHAGGLVCALAWS